MMPLGPKKDVRDLVKKNVNTNTFVNVLKHKVCDMERKKKM